MAPLFWGLVVEINLKTFFLWGWIGGYASFVHASLLCCSIYTTLTTTFIHIFVLEYRYIDIKQISTYIYIYIHIHV